MCTQSGLCSFRSLYLLRCHSYTTFQLKTTVLFSVNPWLLVLIHQLWPTLESRWSCHRLGSSRSRFLWRHITVLISTRHSLRWWLQKPPCLSKLQGNMLQWRNAWNHIWYKFETNMDQIIRTPVLRNEWHCCFSEQILPFCVEIY